MSHKQKDKGDIAVAQIIADLTEKGYSVFVPVVTEHLPFDIIAYSSGISARIQCKYSVAGDIANGTSWTDRNGTHKRRYQATDFDYFGLFLPSLRKCVYPSIAFAGAKITTELPGSVNKNGYLWWEDFIKLTDSVERRFDIDKEKKRKSILARSKTIIAKTKIIWPNDDDLRNMIWLMPLVKVAQKLGVSDKAIDKRLKIHGIQKPPRGYWNQKDNYVDCKGSLIE